MNRFYNIPVEAKKRIFAETGRLIDLPAFAIEKDWWVVQTLRIIKSTEAADALLFKGGTSVSKAWNLIDRFSEDVDLAIDRTFLGVQESPNTNKKLRRLREKSRDYLSSVFIHQLKNGFASYGIEDTEISVTERKSSSADPTQIIIHYPFVTEHSAYLAPRVLLEIGSRSMMEPSAEREISSFVYQHFSEQPFADAPIGIKTVLPERTFLEKAFLLHEEFQKPSKDIRVKRMSRHLYDMEKMITAGIAQKALEWKDLYQDIVAHRMLMTKMKDVDYTLHQPQSINFIPPKEFINAYEKDYGTMNDEMIHSHSLKWKDLINRLQEYRQELNSQSWKIKIPK